MKKLIILIGIFCFNYGFSSPQPLNNFGTNMTEFSLITSDDRVLEIVRNNGYVRSIVFNVDFRSGNAGGYYRITLHRDRHVEETDSEEIRTHYIQVSQECTFDVIVTEKPLPEGQFRPMRFNNTIYNGDQVEVLGGGKLTCKDLI